MNARIPFCASAVAVGLAALALCAGCIFDPRDPEPPSTASPVPYLPQTSSANVWANLERSLEAGHAPGWENNVNPDVFIYLPDSEAETLFPGAFAGWDRAREVAFINNFYNSGVTIEAQMKDDGFTPPPDTGSETVWEGVIYDIIVTNPADNSTTRYRASAIITFSVAGNFWYISGWRDQQGESNPDNPGQLLSSMGVLRGTFASK
ncbi:MAG: hypothetical protein IH621_08070 [Krumholzibacteria bacterium]|nr:hypothetical protein [Candidatus Krumholzibacteria bacterium]